MGLAAYPIAADCMEQFRDMTHDEVDKWVDQIINEMLEDDKQPTVIELTDQPVSDHFVHAIFEKAALFIEF